MRRAVYNLAIPDMLNRALRPAPAFRNAGRLLWVVLSLAMAARAADWSIPEQQLARKIVAVTGAGAVPVTIENRSSLGRRDYDVIQNGLRAALEGVGIHFAAADQAGSGITISLSENPASYVWIAEIRKATGETVVVMVSVARPGAAGTRDAVPLSLRKISLWTQSDPVLDVAVLEENPAPAQIAVLEAERVVLYRLQNSRWTQEQALGIVHVRAWPRDLRGRVIPARDHPFDVYLPGVICRAAGSPLSMSCRESDDPWPLVAVGMTAGNASVFPGAGAVTSGPGVIPPTAAFFAPTRNFFTGVLAPGAGKFSTVPKFYSAAALPRDKYTLWLFAATDHQLHLIDGTTDTTARLGWGSEVASVRTSCGAGWQVLATSGVDQAEDSVRAYEFPDREPVAVSAAVDFPGSITAMWTDGKGDTTVVLVRETGGYEAFRLAMSCTQ